MILEASELKKLSATYVSKELEKQILLISIYNMMLVYFSAGEKSANYLAGKDTDNSTYNYINTTLTSLGYEISKGETEPDGAFLITITF